MTKMRLDDVRVTVERIDGRSVCGVEVGDFFEVTGQRRLPRRTGSSGTASSRVPIPTSG
jgi:uncharacterized repeat protein (TIGR04076 family)